MEKPRQEAGVGASLSFPSHRQSHLRSGTYRTLVQLMSLCYGDSPLATAPPIIPLPQTPDHGGNRGEAGGDDIRESGESIVSDRRELGNMVAQEGKVVSGDSEGAVFLEKGFADTRMVIDEIEQIMGMEEAQDLVNQNDMMVCSSMEGNGFLDGEIGRGQMLMADLENIMKGNEDCDKISNCSTATLGGNQGDKWAGILSADGPPVVMEESGTVGQPQVDAEGGNKKIIDAVGFSSNKSLTVEVSNSSENVKDQSSSLETNLMHEKNEIQQKEVEPEKFVCSNEPMCSSGQMVEDGEFEEGEIFGESQLIDESIDILLDDIVASEKKVDAALISEKRVEEKQISGGTFDEKHRHCNDERTVNDRTSEFTLFNNNVASIANKVTPIELEGSEPDRMVYELGMMQREKGSGKIHKQSGSKNQDVKSKTKKDGVSHEKRQSLTPAGKKEKKKRNKRKKRAEKNRELGVKRLKLQTVLKPKPVTYCRHYLKGRCHEGEQCKFSHDTVPLTKAQPCSHFARQSCMKGDDCPFDHQLSKYPCNNYMTKGSCGRGDDCLFSHKVPLERDVASSSIATEHQLKPSSQTDTDVRLNISRALLKNADASSYSVGAFSDKSKRQLVADTPTRTPDLACKGVNSPFVSKSSIAESSKLNNGSSSQKMNESGRVGNQSNQRMLGVNSPFVSKPSPVESNKFGQGSSSLKMNDSPNKRPEVVPRGINFLSFGKSSLDDSTGKVSLELNRAGGYKQQPSDNEGDRVKLSNHITQSTLRTYHRKKTHPAVLPLGKNLTGGDSVNSGSNSPASLPRCSDKLPVSPQPSGQSSEWLAHKSIPNSAREALISTLTMAKKFDNVRGKSVHESQQLSDKQYNSNANPWKMSASLLAATGQSSENITPKKTPNSSQKALMSTLAFATMFESGMKKNQSAIRTAVNSETGDSRTGEG